VNVGIELMSTERSYYERLTSTSTTEAQPVPAAVIEKLARKLDVPDFTEAHQVEWIWQ
jgi:hypothetical protein